MTFWQKNNRFIVYLHLFYCPCRIKSYCARFHAQLPIITFVTSSSLSLAWRASLNPSRACLSSSMTFRCCWSKGRHYIILAFKQILMMCSFFLLPLLMHPRVVFSSPPRSVVLFQSWENNMMQEISCKSMLFLLMDHLRGNRKLERTGSENIMKFKPASPIWAPWLNVSLLDQQKNIFRWSRRFWVLVNQAKLPADHSTFIRKTFQLQLMLY